MIPIRHMLLSLALLSGCLQTPAVLGMDPPAIAKEKVDTIELPCGHALSKADIQELLETSEGAACKSCNTPIPDEFLQKLEFINAFEKIVIGCYESRLPKLFHRYLKRSNSEGLESLPVAAFNERDLDFLRSTNVDIEVLQIRYAQWRPSLRLKFRSFLRGLIMECEQVEQMPLGDNNSIQKRAQAMKAMFSLCACGTITASAMFFTCFILPSWYIFFKLGSFLG